MAKKAERSALGVLYTGYLEKFNPDARFSDKHKRRFVVLTHVGLHWFKREEGYDLFGEEKGYIMVQDIKEVVPPPESQEETVFHVVTTDFSRRAFRAGTRQECDAWVVAVQCAMKNRYGYRRETLTGLSFLPTGTETIRPAILLGSVASGSGKPEVVFARAIGYGKLLTGLPNLEPNDRLVFTLADGSTATVDVKDLGDGGPKQIKARLNGALSGHLQCSVSPESFKQLDSSQHGGAPPPLGGRISSQHLLDLLLRPESVISVGLASFLATVFFSTTGQASAQLERLALIVTLLGLISQILFPMVLAAAEARRKSQEAVTYLPPIAIKVDDYIVEKADQEVDVSDDPLARNIPQRFIDGMNGDMVEALRRYKITLEWRKSYGTDTMLDEPHPYYDLIKDCYPHYYCMSGREGDPIYIERSGQVDQPRLRAAGCTVDMMVRHYIWATEFLYSHLHPRETAKTITLFDVKGVGIMDLAGDAFDFLRKSATMIQEHYPERAKVIMIVNAPGWFSFLWKMIKPFVHENTQKKVKILKGGRETFEGVSEFVEPQKIPVEYGGTLKFGEEEDSCRWKSPEEVQMREFVHAVNKRHGVEMIKG